MFVFDLFLLGLLVEKKETNGGNYELVYRCTVYFNYVVPRYLPP